MAKEIIEIPSRTLQEYLLWPGHISRHVSPDKVDLSARLVNGPKEIKLKTPILTAAMQSVTGPRMAIAIAKLGGAGVIYCSQPLEKESEMIRTVKRFKAGFVVPEVLSPSDTINSAKVRMDVTGYSKFPVTQDGKPDGVLVGLLTNNDFDPVLHGNLTVSERMKMRDALDIAYQDETQDIKAANKRLREGHHSVLPVVDRANDRLRYLVFRKDMEAHETYPDELLDDAKRYIVGGAFNTHDYMERIPRLIEAGADFLVLDTSQSDSDYVEDTLEFIRGEFPETPIIGGNIVTEDGFVFLVKNGVNAVKVGMGSGSICVTQEQIRVGMGQATAVAYVARARDRYKKETGKYVPICSDGGIITSGDIEVALALGANYVMVGSYVAGTDESNGPEDKVNQQMDSRMTEMRVKHYWGEGSKRAREWSGHRYGHARFAEGFETVVPYAGPLRDHLTPALWKVRESIRKSGSSNITDLHTNATLQVVSQQSITQSRNKPSGV